MEYAIGSGLTFVVLWATWMTWKIIDLSRYANDATEVMDSHSQALHAVADSMVDTKAVAEDKIQMGFVSNGAKNEAEN